MHECTYAWTNDWLTEWMNEWVSDWLTEWMNEWKNERMSQWINEICQLHLPQVLRDSEFSYYYYVKSRSGYSLVHLLPTSSSKSTPRSSIFYDFYFYELSLQSRAPFADLTFQKSSERQFFCWFLSEIELSSLSRTHFANRIFQKCSDADSFFDFYVKSSSRYSLVQMLPTPSSKTAPNVTVLDILKRKSSSRYSPVHVLSTTSADRGPKPRKQRPYFGNHGSHFTRKKHRVSRPRVFSSLNSRVPDLFHFPTTWWWWWCGWHDYIYHVASALLVGSPKSFCLDTRYTVVARLRASKSVASAQGIRNLEPKVVSHGTPRDICFCLPLTVIIGL